MNKKIQFNIYSTPTRIIFGIDSLRKLHKQRFPGEKAILVISSLSSIRGYNILSVIEEQLLIAGIEYTIYENGSSDDISVEKGANIVKEKECDFIIGLGGAKAIDTAKAISVYLFNNGYRKTRLPLWTIPTTAGFGSEINDTCIVWQSKLQKKLYLQDNLLRPNFSLIDPSITRSISPLISMQHGFSILFKSIDIFLSKEVGFQCKYLATIAIKTLTSCLPRITISGNDILARIYISYSNILVSFNSQYRFRMLEEICNSTERSPEVNYGDALLNLSDDYYANMIDSGKYDYSFKEIAEIMGSKPSIVPDDFLSVLRNFKQICGVGNGK